METITPTRVSKRREADLVKRVNQLYHELTQTSFDQAHQRRHRVERRFWLDVARATLQPDHRQNRPDDLVVVDLACGTGFVTEVFVSRLGPNDRLIAIDISEAALDSTARKCAGRLTNLSARPRLQLIAADGQNLPLANRSVDLVAVNAALHHLPDPLATLHEIDRLLKPGGYFALGFEPNHTHFASPVIRSLSQGVTRTAWYASPRQNWRRLSYRLRRATPPHDDVLTRTINQRLSRDGLIAQELTEKNILDLVDPHARGAGRETGFDPVALIKETMPAYEICQLVSSDFLGESGRVSPAVRHMVDATLRTFLPRHGSLFSWLIRKPGRKSPEGRQ